MPSTLFATWLREQAGVQKNSRTDRTLSHMTTNGDESAVHQASIEGEPLVFSCLLVRPFVLCCGVRNNHRSKIEGIGSVLIRTPTTMRLRLFSPVKRA